MVKKIIYIFLGIIIGVVLTIIGLKVLNNNQIKLNTSSQCGGELKKTMYCHKGYFCEVNCNLCNCDVPHCQIDPVTCLPN